MDAVQALTELGGVATWDELLRMSSRRKLRTAIAARAIVRVAHGSYSLPGVEDARIVAARVGGVVSHLSAAQHWGLKMKLPPERPTVTVPRRCSKLGIEKGAVEVHWADLPAAAKRHGVTDVVQTVLDCARGYELDVGLAIADSALRIGIGREDLLMFARESPRTGRSKVVRVLELADQRAANPFESVLRAIALGVPGLQVEPQQWVGDVGRADLVDARRRIAIEAESHAFHSDRASLERDVHRYTAFTRLGWRVVRFTWQEVMFDPAYVRAVLIDVVAGLEGVAAG